VISIDTSGRKDETLMHILSSLERLEIKFDDFAVDRDVLSRSVSLQTQQTKSPIGPPLHKSQAAFSILDKVIGGTS
jgi:hypothetical protein